MLRNIYSIVTLVFPLAIAVASLFGIVSAQNPNCEINIRECTQITSMVLNGQLVQPGETIQVEHGTELHFGLLSFSLSEGDLQTIAEKHNGLSYTYAYAFPVVNGELYESSAYIQVTPKSETIDPLQSGDWMLSLENGPTWTIDGGWGRVIIVVLHESHGQEIVIGRTEIRIDVQPDDITVPDIDSPKAAVWLWKDEAIADEGKQQQVIDYLTAQGFDTLYLHAYFALTQNPTGLSEFIQLAAENDIDIELLAGDPLWALSEYHLDALSFVDAVIDFTETYPVHKPTAIHLDIEPHGLAEWSDDPNDIVNHQIARQYLELLTSIRNRIEVSNQTLKLNIDITFWYDQIEMSYAGTNRSLTEHLMHIVDGVSVMSYRDTVDGPNGVMALVASELETGNTLGVDVFIALETNGGLDDYLTFCEEGLDALVNARQLLTEQLIEYDSFKGMAIHDFLGLQELGNCSQ